MRHDLRGCTGCLSVGRHRVQIVETADGAGSAGGGVSQASARPDSRSTLREADG